MDAGTTTTDRTTRRTVLVTAGIGVLGAAAVGGVLAASGASATTAGAGSIEVVARPAEAAGIEAIWAGTDATTRHDLCTSYLADPAGTWQVLAPVLTAHGADRATTEALLGQRCAETVTVGDLRG